MRIPRGIDGASLPIDVVYKDDQEAAFRDLNPAAPTHIFIVPNREIATGLRVFGLL